MPALEIKVKGLDKVLDGTKKLVREIEWGMTKAGQEASKEIVETEGLQKYPPTTAANRPPVPYYVRGEGMQTARGNDGKSERYGTQFYTKQSDYTTTIGNSAGYAPYLGGDEQARAMARIGWRKLYDVASEKIGKITQIFQAWIDKAINKSGL